MWSFPLISEKYPVHVLTDLLWNPLTSGKRLLLDIFPGNESHDLCGQRDSLRVTKTGNTLRAFELCQYTKQCSALCCDQRISVCQYRAFPRSFIAQVHYVINTQVFKLNSCAQYFCKRGGRKSKGPIIFFENSMIFQHARLAAPRIF